MISVGSTLLFLPKVTVTASPSGIDGIDTQFFCGEPQVVAFNEGFDGLFGQAEAVDQFFMYGVDLLHGFADGEAFVEDERS